MLTLPDGEYLTNNAGNNYLLLPRTPMPQGVAGPSALLGKGAFGTVSVALDQNLEPFVVKEIKMEKNDPKLSKLLSDVQKEITFMHHLGFTAELIFSPSNDPQHLTVFILQSLIEGLPLGEYFERLVDQSKLPENQDELAKLELMSSAVKSFVAAFKAVEALHKIRPLQGNPQRHASIIHGDLHPDNIIYNPYNDFATAIDFGLSYLLPEDEDRIYVEVEKDVEIANLHRAPETVKAQKRRNSNRLEIRFDHSSDIYSLAIDCAIWSGISGYVPDIAGKELASLMDLFKALSQEITLGGTGKSEDRKSLTYGIERLHRIQLEISMRMAQYRILKSMQNCKKNIDRITQLNHFQNHARRLSLPVDLQESIKTRAAQIQQRAIKSADAVSDLREKPLLTSQLVFSNQDIEKQDDKPKKIKSKKPPIK